MVYGYVRVSSKEENEDRQIIALNGLGIPEARCILISNRVKILTDLSTSL